MLECNQERVKQIRNEAEADVIRKELIETHLMLYDIDKQPLHLIKVAELAILNKDYDIAKSHLRESLETEGVSTELTQRASSLFSSLSSKKP